MLSRMELLTSNEKRRPESYVSKLIINKTFIIWTTFDTRIYIEQIKLPDYL